MYPLPIAPISIRNCRIDVAADSQVVIDTSEGQGSTTSSEFTAANKDLFYVLTGRNLCSTFLPNITQLTDHPAMFRLLIYPNARPEAPAEDRRPEGEGNNIDWHLVHYHGKWK